MRPADDELSLCLQFLEATRSHKIRGWTIHGSILSTIVRCGLPDRWSFRVAAAKAERMNHPSIGSARQNSLNWFGVEAVNIAVLLIDRCLTTPGLPEFRAIPSPFLPLLWGRDNLRKEHRPPSSRSPAATGRSAPLFSWIVNC